MAEYKFSVASDFAVVGTDPEFADYDNPRGEIIRERFFMVAEDVAGRQFRYGFEESEFAAEVVFQHFAPPVSKWPYFRAAYGSQAYQQEGWEDDQLRSEFESELGPDWYLNQQVSLEVRGRLF